jgi:Rieske Fe-S protein
VSDEKTGRRGFLNYLIGGGVIALAGAVLYPIFRYLKPPQVAEAEQSQVTACTLGELRAAPGRYKIFKFGRAVGIIVLGPHDDIRAFSATCTHLDCTVQYRPDWNVLWCACHNGKYDLAGRNIAGPPPRPLEQWVAHHDAASDNIFVSKTKGGA